MGYTQSNLSSPPLPPFPPATPWTGHRSLLQLPRQIVEAWPAPPVWKFPFLNSVVPILNMDGVSPCF